MDTTFALRSYVKHTTQFGERSIEYIFDVQIGNHQLVQRFIEASYSWNRKVRSTSKQDSIAVFFCFLTKIVVSML